MKYFILLFSCLVSLRSFGQGTPAKHHNKIDELATTEKVQEFAREVTGDTFLIVHDKIDSQSSTTGKTVIEKLWRKVDINDDGRTDLILVEKIYPWSNDHMVLCIMDTGGNKFLSNLFRNNYSVKAVPEIKKIDAHTVILLQGYKNPHWPNESDAIIDTLWFMQGDFVEYNPLPKHYNIQEINYQTTPCFGSCPVFELKLNSKREAKLHETQLYSRHWDKQSEEEEKKEGDYHVTIDTAHFNAVIDMLNYIDFANLNNDYTIGAVTDNPSCGLTISYDDGKIKKIHDYGKQGTFGLSHLYKLLSDLRKNQHWVKD